MPLKRPPFTTERLEEEKEEGERLVTSMSVNPEEAAIFLEMQKILDTKSQAKAIKFFSIVGLNVVRNTFGPKLAKQLFKKERSRLSDYIDWKG